MDEYEAQQLLRAHQIELGPDEHRGYLAIVNDLKLITTSQVTIEEVAPNTVE